jgi:hypothetical protein
MSMNDVLNTFPSERFLAESPFDIIEHFSMGRIGLVQDIPELKVRRTQAVAEVLSKDPSAICMKDQINTQSQQPTFGFERTSVSSLLDRMPRLVIEKEERVVRETKEQGRFFHYLENGVLDWSRMRVRKRVEIEGYDRNAVRELLWRS